MTAADLELAVREAIAWLNDRPHRDYIDAAYHVATAGAAVASGIRGERWPEFVAAVKKAAQTPAVRA